MAAQHGVSDGPSIKLFQPPWPLTTAELNKTYSGITTRADWSGDDSRPHGLSKKQHEEVRKEERRGVERERRGTALR